MGKVTVLGLGQSLELFNPESYDFTIGVNDIYRKVKTDVVVCLNRTRDFPAERLKWITDCNPKAFFSQIVSWDVKQGFVKIDFEPGYPDRYIDVTRKRLWKSYFSPFVAVQIAYKYYDATEIHIFGVDMTNHPLLNGELCRKIKTHFSLLRKDLERHNVKVIVYGEGILKNI